MGQERINHNHNHNLDIPWKIILSLTSKIWNNFQVISLVKMVIIVAVNIKNKRGSVERVT
jgi:hypothetical protein